MDNECPECGSQDIVEADCPCNGLDDDCKICDGYGAMENFHECFDCGEIWEV